MAPNLSHRLCWEIYEAKMKNNISVFILIILIASSFKYRAKTGEAANIDVQNRNVLEVPGSNGDNPKADFAAFVDKMQEANRQLAKGDSKALKELWLHAEDVTIYCGSSSVQVKGWAFVEERIDWHCSQVVPGSTYTFEKISVQSGENFGSLQQTEHYTSQDGQKMNLGVTVLFERRNGSWKIVHRHAENLSPRVAYM
jgi:ketosteroid isomerase-like protein